MTLVTRFFPRLAWSFWLFGILLLILSPHLVRAEQYDVSRLPIQAFFPGADYAGEFTGDPPAAPVYREHRLIGYLFLTDQVAPIPAYSGKPITTLVGLDIQGKITGVRILKHEEPILVVGVKESDLERFIGQYPGNHAADRIQVGGGQREGYVSVDGITGATITVMVLNSAIMRSAQKVAASRGLLQGTTPPVHHTSVAQPAPPVASPASPPASPAAEEPPAVPMWKQVWHERRFQIAVLIAALTLLTAILVFQDWLVRHPTLLVYVRDGFLVFTVVFIGWYALAQLSVVNVLTFVHAVTRDFRWETFLIDPMTFILWAFVGVTLLLWGRGVYCGWLCPFGALQELTNQLGRRLGIRQLEFPDVVHERLWAVKYIILLVLFGVSLQSVAEAERYAEIEPFKTAFILRFHREWGYVIYALALVAISVVNRKFFCKYMCPLGAALAIPSRHRIFDWLRHRKECGRPCNICSTECEVRAIRPTGEINANECHYCLDCQVTYWNAYKCPPLVEKRKRREKATRLAGLPQEVPASTSSLREIPVRLAPPRTRTGTDPS